ncbi:general stress protein [Actinoplanes sp. NPDC049599]|uniref:general stress protein n=1 Tax=Actinoplanes sp. NPDC049599 TaxID=3363903 RepID=UPI00378E326D
MTTPAENPPPATMPGAAGAVPPGPGGVPAMPAADPAAGAGAHVPTVTVATYPDYALAQRAVDYLSDNEFPVQKTAIVGTDLRLVENVLGRMTTVRAALAGAASGAWFGLFIGLFIGIFSDSNWFGLIFLGLLIGAAWGAIFGAIAQAMTGGRRDFTSRSSLQASQYAVVVEADVADGARQLLTRLNWQTSGAS